MIILDEFTNALDKNSSIDLYEFLMEYKKTHEAVIINITHNLSDLEYMEGNTIILTIWKLQKLLLKTRL